MKIAFKYQIAISHLLVLIILFSLVSLTLSHHWQINHMNEDVRQLAVLTDRLHVAIAAGQRMTALLDSISQTTSVSTRGDLGFSYVEQAQIFKESSACKECLSILKPELSKAIQKLNTKLSYEEPINYDLHLGVLQELVPKLEAAHKALWTHKRLAYIDYYKKFRKSGSNLTKMSLILLLLCVIVASVGSVWTINSTRKRLMAINQLAETIASGDAEPEFPENGRNDEFDILMNNLKIMTRKLVQDTSIKKIVEGAEKEKKRIAMDLHDQVLCDLNAIAREVEENPKLSEALQQAQSNIRRIVDDLHPRVLDNLGLKAALESYLHRVSKNTNIVFDFEEKLDDIFNAEQKLHIYRICLEMLENAQKHAEATRIEFIARHNGTKNIILAVEDNGIGFDAKVIRGHGLNNIAYRVKQLNAQLHINHSRFSSGTRIEVTLEDPNV